MSYRIEIGPAGSPDVTLTDSDLFRVDVAKPHTAVADFEAEIPYTRAMQNHAMKAVRIYSSGTLLFRGYLLEIDWNEQRGTTRLAGPGIEDDLEDSGVVASYSRIAVDDAIRDAWSSYTGFNASVQAPQTSQQATDEPIVDVPSSDTFADLAGSIPADKPLAIQDVDGDGKDELALLPVSWGREGENQTSGDGKGTVSDVSYSDGAAMELADTVDQPNYDFTTEHDIPSGDWAVGFRIVAKSGNDMENPPFEIRVDTNVIWAANADSLNAGTLDWRSALGDFDLSAGSHSLEFAVTGVGSSAIHLDFIAACDVRYTNEAWGWDNTVHADNGYLDEPRKYPASVQHVFTQQTTPWNVIGIGADSTWSDLSGGQEIATSADGRQSWTASQNTDSVDHAYPSNAGTTVDVRVTLDAYGTRDTATPRKNFKRQYIDDWTTHYDGNDLPVIDGQTFRGSPLQVLQDLHRHGGYRFAVDHAATDANGNLTKKAESFSTGSVTKTADWSVINRNPKLSFADYANEVTVWGALQNDGTRPTVTLQDDSEVSQYGKQPYSEINPRLDTLDAVKSYARSKLASKVEERTRKGTLQVLPTDILPGYDYPVDWLADGTTTDTPLNRVEFQEGADQLEGRLQFSQDNDVTGTVVSQGYEIRSTKTNI